MTRLIVSAVFLIGLLAIPTLACADHEMVLIANEENTVEDLSPVDLRKLYLGFSVANGDGRSIRAVTNASSPRLWEIFLQDVMGMSARSYDRRLLTLTLQSGRRRPEVVVDLDELLKKLENDKYALSFVWAEDVEDVEGIKVLRVLWRH